MSPEEAGEAVGKFLQGLEKATKKDNKNSSKPSSQTEKDESALALQGSHGKGKPENNTMATNPLVNETVTISNVWLCDIC